MSVRLGIASGDWIHPKKLNSDKPHWGGSGWARMGQYVSLFPFETHVGVLTWISNRFFIVDIAGGVHDVDVIYMQRLMHQGLLTHIPMAQKAGQIIINDLDDWYWGLSVTNQAYWINHPSKNPTENTNHYKGVIARSNFVTVSTPYLADRIKQFVRCPIIVLPNYVDVARFKGCHTDSGSTTPTVGWVGSTAHRSQDIQTMSGWLKPMAENGAVHLYHGGHHESAPTFASELGVSEELVRTRNSVPAEEYPYLMDMDIGVVPLNKIPFNEAKSDIKGLEYASAGVPFIAQDTSSYKSLANDYGIGLVAKNAHDWIRGIKSLSDPSLRTDLGSQFQDLVRQRDISIGAKNLIDVLTNW